MTRSKTLTTLLGLAALAGAGCERERLPPRRRYVLPPEVDAEAPDVVVPDRLCALRATAGEDLSVGAGHTRAAVTWNGIHYGVAWLRDDGGDRAVGFVRVAPPGRRLGVPARVTERGFVPGAPAVLWNGASWSVFFDGGFGDARGDIYQSRVDGRGNAVGAPWRMTRGQRDDVEPAIAARAQGFVLSWIAREEHGRRSVLYGQLLDRWDAPRSMAVRLLDTNATLASTKVVWADSQSVFTCLSSRAEVQAVDFVRLDERGLPTGALRHVSPDRLGGVEVVSRYDVAWGGGSLGVVWSELREGATQVFFRAVTARGNALGGDVMVSADAPSAVEPTIARVADGVFAVAMRVERDGLSRVWVRTVDATGAMQQGRVELQGADGQAGTPALAYDGEALGVVTTSRRAVAFHRVAVGRCVAP